MLTQQALIGGSGASEPDEVSLLHILFANRQAPQAQGPETDLFDGAAGHIPGLIARRLGDSIVLDLPVSAISTDGRGVTGGPGNALSRPRHIVAVPPFLAGQIAYDRALPMRAVS